MEIKSTLLCVSVATEMTLKILLSGMDDHVDLEGTLGLAFKVTDFASPLC